MLCRKSGEKLGHLKLNHPCVVFCHISSARGLVPDFRPSIFKVLLCAPCTYFKDAMPEVWCKLWDLNLNRPYVVSYHISSSHCFAPDFRHSIFKVLLCASCTYFPLEWEAHSGMCRRSTSTFKKPCDRCAALDMPE